MAVLGGQVEKRAWIEVRDDGATVAGVGPTALLHPVGRRPPPALRATSPNVASLLGEETRPPFLPPANEVSVGGSTRRGEGGLWGEYPEGGIGGFWKRNPSTRSLRSLAPVPPLQLSPFPKGGPPERSGSEGGSHQPHRLAAARRAKTPSGPSGFPPPRPPPALAGHLPQRRCAPGGRKQSLRSWGEETRPPFLPPYESVFRLELPVDRAAALVSASRAVRSS